MKYFVTVIAEVKRPAPHLQLTDHTTHAVIVSFVIDVDVESPIEPQLNQRVKELTDIEYEVNVKQITAFSPINEFYACMIESLTDKVTYLSLDAVQLPITINKELPNTFFLYQNNFSKDYVIAEAHATVTCNLVYYTPIATAKTLEECRALAKEGKIITEFLCDI